MNDSNPYKPPQATLHDEPKFSGVLLGRPQSRGVTDGWLWVKQGFALLTKDLGPWLLALPIAVVVFIAVILASFLVILPGMLFVPLLFVIVPVVGLAVITLFYMLLGGVYQGCSESDAGGAFNVGHYFSGVQQEPKPYVFLTLWYIAIALGTQLIMFMVAFIVTLGDFGQASALFLEYNSMSSELPVGSGFQVAIMTMVELLLTIPALMAFYFAPMLIALYGLSCTNALLLSFMGCLRNILPLIWLSIISVFLVIVAILPLGLGLLIFVPLTVTTAYCAHKRIFLR